MSVIVDYEGDHVLICKGAVQDMFPACTQYQIDDEIYPLVDMLKTDIMEEYVDLSKEGFRVLAIAYREFPRTQREFASKGGVKNPGRFGQVPGTVALATE